MMMMMMMMMVVVVVVMMMMMMMMMMMISGQTHEFKIHATRQRARAGYSTICYRKKQIDVSF